MKFREIVMRHGRERDAASAKKVEILQAIRAGADNPTVMVMMAECIGLWTSDTGFAGMVKAAMRKRGVDE